MRRLILTLPVLVLLLPSPARAAVGTSCSFDAGTATVAATIGSGASVTLGRSGDSVTFGGAPCGAADVHNTDAIEVSAPDASATASLSISMIGGPFAPGATTESDGSNEIEIGVDLNPQDALSVVGTAGPDAIDVTALDVDLLAGGAVEPEVTLTGAIAGPFVVLGASGSDALSIHVAPATVRGGGGDDTVEADQAVPSTFDGGTGTDEMAFSSLVGVRVIALGGEQRISTPRPVASITRCGSRPSPAVTAGTGSTAPAAPTPSSEGAATTPSSPPGATIRSMVATDGTPYR
jgi:hypothetical protein